MPEKAMLVNVAKCTACRGCQVACKQWNQLPGERTQGFGGPGLQNPADLSGTTWTLVRFHETRKAAGVDWQFRKLQCMHCTQAACVELCPSSAVSRDAAGAVVVDEARCIGCGFCEQFCPFGLARLDAASRKLRKCRLCGDRVTAGLEPACAKTCPTGAIRYGDRDALLSEARQSAAQSGGRLQLYGENELGGLHVLYLLDAPPLQYGLPVDPKLPDPYQVYRFLQQTLAQSPQREAILATAARRYFGRVLV